MTSNRLPILAADIRAAHADVGLHLRSAAERALDAGKMLAEAKALVGHGGWAAFLDEARVPSRSASRYMALHRSGIIPAMVADLGFERAECYASAGLKMVPPDGQAVKAIGCDLDHEAGSTALWWSEGGACLRYWQAAYCPAAAVVTTIRRRIYPWMAAALHEREPTRYEQYREHFLPVSEARSFIAKIEIDENEPDHPFNFYNALIEGRDLIWAKAEADR